MSSDRRHHRVTRCKRLFVRLALRALCIATSTAIAVACAGTENASQPTAAGAVSMSGNASAGAAAASSAGATASSAGTPAAASGVSMGSAGTAAAASGVSAAAGAGSAAMSSMPRADPSGAVMVGMGPPTFTRVWEEILMPKGCAGAYCHGSGQGGLKFMKKEDAYTALVGVMASGPKCGSSGKLRVKASDPDASLILDKMSHEMPACGDAMPIGTKLEPNCVSMNTSVCNSMADLKLMRDWIAAGALND